MQTSNSIFHPAVATYINAFEPAVQEKLLQLRSFVYTIVPEVEEGISYKMPCYKYKGVLFYMAAYKQHIGFYPTAAPIAHFAAQLSAYKTSKGAIQFPLDQDLPMALIKEIILFNLYRKPKK